MSTEEDLSEVLFLHTQCTSFDPSRARIMYIGTHDCGEFGKNVILKHGRYFVRQDDEIIDSLPADIIARNKIDIAEYKKEAMETNDASDAINDAMADRVIAMFDSPSSMCRVFEHDNIAAVGLKEANVINLTYIITRFFNVPSDRWSSQGYSTPPAGDPLFVETCFYNFVPHDLIPKENGFYIPLSVEQMGAMILEQLVKTVPVKRMIMESKIHDQTSSDNEMLIRS